MLFVILFVNFLFFWKDFLTTDYIECTEPESFILLKTKEFQIIKSLIQISAFSVHSVVKKTFGCGFAAPGILVAKTNLVAAL